MFILTRLSSKNIGVSHRAIYIVMSRCWQTEIPHQPLLPSVMSGQHEDSGGAFKIFALNPRPSGVWAEQKRSWKGPSGCWDSGLWTWNTVKHSHLYCQMWTSCSHQSKVNRQWNGCYCQRLKEIESVKPAWWPRVVAKSLSKLWWKLLKFAPAALSTVCRQFVEILGPLLSFKLDVWMSLFFCVWTRGCSRARSSSRMSCRLCRRSCRLWSGRRRKKGRSRGCRTRRCSPCWPSRQNKGKSLPGSLQ